MARAIEVTAWQSVDAVCLCCLTTDPVTGLKSLLAIPIHLSMLSPHDLQRVQNRSVYSMLYIFELGLTHSPVVHVRTFLCDILWPEVQSHSDDMCM